MLTHPEQGVYGRLDKVDTLCDNFIFGCWITSQLAFFRHLICFKTMAVPRINVYLDVVSPFGYIAFSVLKVRLSIYPTIA